MLFRLALSLAVLLGLTTAAPAQLRLPSVFSDHMVLQQGEPIMIWGWAAPGEEIEIDFGIRQGKVRADPDGRWEFLLGALDASHTPRDLILEGGQDRILIRDILIGEVWLCSGQSNMVWRVRQCDGAEEAARAATDTRIRMFTAANRSESQKQDDVPGQWVVASPEAVADFSATAYYFGRPLLEELDVPIGLVNSSWGGSTVQAWTSRSVLEELPTATRTLREFAEYEAFLQQDSSRWAAIDVDTARWEHAVLPRQFRDLGHDIDGVIWFRRKLELPKDWIGKELELSLGKIDDADETWFNGRRIGGTHNWQAMRNYSVPGNLVQGTEAVIAVRVLDTGGPGGFMSSHEAMKLGLAGQPDESLPLSGAWKQVVASKRPPAVAQHRPAHLYNGMIHPLLRYAFRGVIWYQGENNAFLENSFEYYQLFPAMIKDWRMRFRKPNWPFLIVQLPNFGYEPNQFWDFETVRDAQFQAHRILKHTGLAVTIDIGDPKDIHPRNKLDVGHRLSRWALHQVYGREEVIPSGPLFREAHQPDGGRLRLDFETFGSTMELRAGSGSDLRGFEVAGADRVFHPARAQIVDDHILLGTSKVKQPALLRYAWSGDPTEANLVNAEGLPAAPFKSTVKTP